MRKQADRVQATVTDASAAYSSHAGWCVSCASFTVQQVVRATRLCGDLVHATATVSSTAQLTNLFPSILVLYMYTAFAVFVEFQSLQRERRLNTLSVALLSWDSAAPAFRRSAEIPFSTPCLYVLGKVSLDTRIRACGMWQQTLVWADTMSTRALDDI
jgi:hypothetical protein